MARCFLHLWCYFLDYIYDKCTFIFQWPMYDNNINEDEIHFTWDGKTVCHFNNTDGFVNKICKYNLMDLEGIGKKAISNWVKAIIISLPETTSQLIQHSFRITIMKISSRTTVKGITTSNIWWYEDMMIWCLILFSDWWRLFFTKSWLSSFYLVIS